MLSTYVPLHEQIQTSSNSARRITSMTKFARHLAASRGGRSQYVIELKTRRQSVRKVCIIWIAGANKLLSSCPVQPKPQFRRTGGNPQGTQTETGIRPGARNARVESGIVWSRRCWVGPLPSLPSIALRDLTSSQKNSDCAGLRALASTSVS